MEGFLGSMESCSRQSYKRLVFTYVGSLSLCFWVALSPHGVPSLLFLCFICHGSDLGVRLGRFWQTGF